MYRGEFDGSITVEDWAGVLSHQLGVGVHPLVDDRLGAGVLLPAAEEAVLAVAGSALEADHRDGGGLYRRLGVPIASHALVHARIRLAKAVQRDLGLGLPRRLHDLGARLSGSEGVLHVALLSILK